jgi:hypothetical protein
LSNSRHFSVCVFIHQLFTQATFKIENHHGCFMIITVHTWTTLVVLLSPSKEEYAGRGNRLPFIDKS